MPLGAVIGAPLVMLLVGGTAGWLLRDSESGNSTGGGAATVATVLGATLPSQLDDLAPVQPLPAAPNPAVVDPANIIGFVAAGAAPGGATVPAAAAIDLPLTVGAAATVVDPETLQPATATAPAAATPPADATPVQQLPPLAPPPSTLPTPDGATAAPVTVADGATTDFVDPCSSPDTQCAGAAGVVLDEQVVDDDGALDPLRVTMPVAGAGGYAPLCDEVEAGNVPDLILTPATRPTVAVLVNQPSTLALTGTWADGTPLPKTTMVTLAAHDAEWQRAWAQDGVQRDIIACLTLPLDDVRAHATAGVAELRTEVLAISATGRADVGGQVTLHVPTDGEDPLFAERLVVANRGEQRRSDGVLYPAVHVHYAFLTDAVVPTGSGLDPATTHVYDQHAFVEGADCSGWALNQQGRDRTESSSFTVTNEQRTVAGRVRNVTIVDGEAYLDPSMPSGWQGHFCVRLTATDEAAKGPAAKMFTLALRGATVRSPRTADYAVSVLLDDVAFPADQPLQVTWQRTDGEPVCAAAQLSDGGAQGGPGATCSTSARLAPDGIWVTIATGTAQPVIAARVPVNTEYCNPDDPYAFIADGCSTGFSQPLNVPAGETSVRVVLHVDRTAGAGGLWQDPSHAWKISAVTAFAS